MRPANLKLRPILFFPLLLSILVLVFTVPSKAQDLTGKSENSATKGVQGGTRIIISTSGPAKFNSYWLDSPPRLVVRFQTRNIVSKIDNEVMVNQGVIKKITSEYFEEGQRKSLKSLTFELLEKVPYKIWQEANTILLDIQTSQETAIFPENGKEIFAKSETKEVMIKRLEAMDAALTKVSAISHSPLEAHNAMAKFPKTRRKGMSIGLWLIGLTLISGLAGLLFWLFWRRYRLILDKNLAAQEIEKLKSQVTEKNKLLEQEEIIRKAIEDASKTKEKEFEQQKLELQKKEKLLDEEEKARKTTEEALSQKEKEVVEVKGSLESLKEVLVEKGIAKKLTTPQKEGELWIAGKSAERREFPRLDLSKDYNRTIILRIESPDKSKSIKSFANNIGLGGLCFETRHEFNEKERLRVRLFFFGDKVPMMRMQAKVIWSKIDTPVSRYGISFTRQEEKDKTELNSYIESKISEATTYGTK
jgi:hypothetical protein